MGFVNVYRNGQFWCVAANQWEADDAIDKEYDREDNPDRGARWTTGPAHTLAHDPALKLNGDPPGIGNTCTEPSVSDIKEQQKQGKNVTHFYMDCAPTYIELVETDASLYLAMHDGNIGEAYVKAKVTHQDLHKLVRRLQDYLFNT